MEIGAVNDPDDLSSKPAETKPAAPVVETPKRTPVPPAAPKSDSPHIQIQNPPVTETKEDQRTLALRLAGEEAAARAKQNALQKLGTKPATTEGDGKAAPTTEPSAKGTESAESATEKVDSVSEAKPIGSQTSASQEEKTENPIPTPSRGRRTSVAPEIVPPLKRPSLADETAAVSTANFRAENADVLGLIDHHRGSIVSVTNKDEQDQVRKEIRESVTEAPEDGDLQALRKEDADKKQRDAIDEVEEEEETTVSGESDTETSEAAKEKTEKKAESPVAAAKEKEKEEKDKEEKEKDEDEDEDEEEEEEEDEDEEEEKAPQKQDPKDASKAGVSVED
jgi:hypothetical protein